MHEEFSLVIGFDNLVEHCQSNQLAAGLATVEYCRRVYEKLPPPMPRFPNPQRIQKLIRQLKQNPEVKPSSLFQEQLNPSRESSPNGMPLPKTREQQEAEQWMKRLIEEADDDSQQLTQLLQRQGKQAVLQAQQYADSLGETQIRQMLRAALAASEQKLAESAEWGQLERSCYKVPSDSKCFMLKARYAK